MKAGTDQVPEHRIHDDTKGTKQLWLSSSAKADDPVTTDVQFDRTGVRDYRVPRLRGA